MRLLLLKIIAVCCTFLYIYPVDLGVLNSRNFISVLAIILFIVELLRQRINYHSIPKTLFFPGILSLLVSLWSLETAILNNIYDPYYVNCFPSFLTLLLSSWFITRLYKEAYGNVEVRALTINAVSVLHIQFLLSLSMFFIPSFRDSVYSIIPMDENASESLEDTTFRLHGIGANFFDLGVINCTIILFITASMKYIDSIRLKRFYFISILYFIIVGMMMARTTLLVVPFALSYYAYKNRKFISNSIKVICKIIIGIIVILILFKKPIIGFLDENEQLLRFGFEHFYNFFEGNGFTSKSTDVLADLLVLPDNLLTWIIGDAKITGNSGYYMSTDIGYARAIFYFGLIGLCLLISLYISIVNSISKICKSYSLFFYLLLILFFVMYYKGICNLLYFFSLFFFLSDDKKKYNNAFNLKG